MTSASTRRDNNTNQKSDIKEEVKEFQGSSSTLEEFMGAQ